MSFALTADQLQIQDLIRRVAKEKVAYFNERDRWFRESVTDAVRLHS